VITRAASDGRESGGERIVPAASTIKIFVASAFWRSKLDPAERVEMPAVPWSLADKRAGPLTLGDRALLALAVSVDDERVVDALAVAKDSLLPYLLPGRDLRVKTGELDSGYHEVALVDKSLAVAVCSSPPALPSEVAAVAAGVAGRSLQ